MAHRNRNKNPEPVVVDAGTPIVTVTPEVRQAISRIRAAVGDFNDDSGMAAAVGVGAIASAGMGGPALAEAVTVAKALAADPHADGVAPSGDVVLAPVLTTPSLVSWPTGPASYRVTVPASCSGLRVYLAEDDEPVFVWPTEPTPLASANAALDAVAKEEGYARLPDGNALLALVLADPTVAFKVYDAVKSGSVKAAKWKQVTAGRHHLETYPGGATLGIVVTSLNDSRKWVPEWDRGAFAGPESDLDGAKAWLAERAARAGYPVM